uniref:Caerulein precursor fragment R6 n=1 Tax=Xenopus ruwenzoriensis TaxID=105430 RepID=CPFR6_XENRU|nr:RecName: Full=Caerulein precursor fragment R6; AltName: Full=CPF-R6 [Xenopus ruwenzoriensis]
GLGSVLGKILKMGANLLGGAPKQ